MGARVCTDRRSPCPVEGCCPTSTCSIGNASCAGLSYSGIGSRVVWSHGEERDTDGASARVRTDHGTDVADEDLTVVDTTQLLDERIDV